MSQLMVDRVRTFLAAVFVVALFLSPGGEAMAQPSPDAGIELALRTGIAIPFGQLQGGTNQNLDRYAGSAVPIIVEGGYRLDSHLFFGARFQYDFPQFKNPNGNCNGDVSCEGSIVHLGLEAIYRIAPEQYFAPWVGLGGGYQWLTADYFSANAGAGVSMTGFQGLVQAGGDVRINPKFVLGPFMEIAVGRFDSATTRLRLGNTTTENTADIADTDWHTWLILGVRGAFGL